MQSPQPAEDSGGLVAVLLEGPARGRAEVLQVPAAVVRGQSKEAHRRYRADAEVAGRRAPPTVDLTLTLRNTTQQSMRVWVAGPQTELRLGLHGPGALSAPVQGSIEQKPQAVTLRPGEDYAIPIKSLQDDHRWWYWTEPGDYTLTAQFTTRGAMAEGGQRRLVARGGPVTIHVEGN
jgi:hypothetical protein